MSVPENPLIFNRIVSPKIQFQRERRLPGNGQVLVTQGAVVSPSDVVAEYQEPGPTRLIDAAEALGVAPHKVERLLLVEVGESIEEGQLIAQRGGLLGRKSLHAPMNGTLVAVGEGGHLVFRAAPRRHQLRALMQGTVVEVNSTEGITIESSGALVQGIWGNGREDFGLLQMKVQAADETVSEASITAGMRGTIIVGGLTMDEVALYRASEVQAKGVIIGSLPHRSIDFVRKLPIPILLTEGFGSHPICRPIFDLLQELDGRDATLGARYGPENARARPELFVPLLGEAQPLFVPGPFTSNDRVRILSGRYFGQTGTVEEAGERRHTLPNELVVKVLSVRLDGGERIVTPRTNVERLIQ